MACPDKELFHFRFPLTCVQISLSSTHDGERVSLLQQSAEMPVKLVAGCKGPSLSSEQGGTRG